MCCPRWCLDCRRGCHLKQASGYFFLLTFVWGSWGSGQCWQTCLTTLGLPFVFTVRNRSPCFVFEWHLVIILGPLLEFMLDNKVICVHVCVCVYLYIYIYIYTHIYIHTYIYVWNVCDTIYICIVYICIIYICNFLKSELFKLLLLYCQIRILVRNSILSAF